MCPGEGDAEDCPGDDDTPFGDALHDLAVDADTDIDPVEAVRELRERERR
ncbi:MULTISPECIES: hypothetical protein [Halolamina]|uniref:Uncharacterized protein n=1 Tax=Halolamina pelagica TaxID=699431 RepID=A0A1I5VUR4_9EURY|nr:MULTISPECIES: hypothetical protein [Halolamina]NHX37869.1 hypothetical protein [Halolamina sp. R1-12]SFQ11288.1 hypothetical protein SAMN05216277_12020 [Halolamina pelagica]